VLVTQGYSTCSPRAALQMNITRFNTFPGEVGVERQTSCEVISCLVVDTFDALLVECVEIC
jgi:hypothetical protein